MLPLRNRLKKREDFAIVFSKGAYAAGSGLGIKYLPNDSDSSRIGFPIGKKYSKKSVVRNRSRRVLRAASANLILEMKPGFDVIVLINPIYQNIEFEKTAAELKKIFRKANLLM